MPSPTRSNNISASTELRQKTVRPVGNAAQRTQHPTWTRSQHDHRHEAREARGLKPQSNHATLAPRHDFPGHLRSSPSLTHTGSFTFCASCRVVYTRVSLTESPPVVCPATARIFLTSAGPSSGPSLTAVGVGGSANSRRRHIRSTLLLTAPGRSNNCQQVVRIAAPVSPLHPPPSASSVAAAPPVHRASGPSLRDGEAVLLRLLPLWPPHRLSIGVKAGGDQPGVTRLHHVHLAAVDSVTLGLLQHRLAHGLR